MKLTRTTRWAAAGTALGLSAALSAGVAFAATSSRPDPAPQQAPSASATPGGLGATGLMGGSTMGGSTMGGSAAMMGSTSMGGASGGQATLTQPSLAALVSRGEQGASIDNKANTVTYRAHTVTLVALASPHGQPNMTWEIDGLVNPTVVVQPGAHVDVVVANTDWGYMHGFELTSTPPPYPYMAMAGTADNFFLMPLPPRTAKDTATASYYTRSASFTTTSGTYHYFCPVPGHAAAGMFGTLLVR
ncbi:MAG: plastocyanin/azurin family copper-binding protein [Actinomycetota bacterium]|jgi:rusticyanin|nr:plastocyanin/azurin family copper-binding protein [Actinomycetota bacterium]